MNSVVVETLEQWREQTGSAKYVFESPKTGGKFDNCNSAWQVVRKEAGLEDFRWHDMRHDFASQLVMANVDLNKVRELMGHSALTMTLRYAHLAPHVKAEAVERLVRHTPEAPNIVKFGRV